MVVGIADLGGERCSSTIRFAANRWWDYESVMDKPLRDFVGITTLKRFFELVFLNSTASTGLSLFGKTCTRNTCIPYS